MKESQDLNNSFICNVESRDLNILQNNYSNFKLRKEYMNSYASKKYIFFPKYIIVNQTEHDIKIGKAKDRAKIVKSMDCIYYNPLFNTKVQFRTLNYGIYVLYICIYI